MLDSFDFGLVRLEISSHRFVVNEKSINLRNKEYSLMEFFMRNPGRVLSRTKILEEVWDRNAFCSTNTVDVHISSLRSKIKPYAPSGLIRTIPCVGYIFDPNAEIEAQASSDY